MGVGVPDPSPAFRDDAAGVAKSFVAGGVRLDVAKFAPLPTLLGVETGDRGRTGVGVCSDVRTRFFEAVVPELRRRFREDVDAGVSAPSSPPELSEASASEGGGRKEEGKHARREIRGDLQTCFGCRATSTPVGLTLAAYLVTARELGLPGGCAFGASAIVRVGTQRASAFADARALDLLLIRVVLHHQVHSVRARRRRATIGTRSKLLFILIVALDDARRAAVTTPVALAAFHHRLLLLLVVVVVLLLLGLLGALLLVSPISSVQEGHFLVGQHDLLLIPVVIDDKVPTRHGVVALHMARIPTARA
eukprot:scaffold2739_cov257-Pinguiococcus_pyrenoidosus.AAC.10